jgi:hypothetical protein
MELSKALTAGIDPAHGAVDCPALFRPGALGNAAGLNLPLKTSPSFGGSGSSDFDASSVKKPKLGTKLFVIETRKDVRRKLADL